MTRSLVSILLVAPAVASANSPGWTAGVHLGTNFIANGYPVAFPPKIGSYDFDEDEEGLADDVDGDGEPDATSLARARADLVLGIEGHRWISGGGRLGLAFNGDVGARFTDVQGLATFDKTWDVQTLYLEAGAGLGFSSTSWRGEDPEERLRMPGYPLRVGAGLLAPVSRTVALQARLVGQMVIPAKHRYTDLAGNEQDVGGAPFLYTQLGLQLGVLVGQFGREDPEPAERPPAIVVPPPPPRIPEPPVEEEEEVPPP